MVRRYTSFGQTQNSKKVWEYYERLVQTQEFREDLEKIRFKCKIPSEGYPDRRSAPPQEWLGSSKKLFQSIENLCKTYNLYPGHWWLSLEFYIFYSKLDMPDINSGELLTLADINEFETKEKGRNFTSFYPLLIGVNPYASQRDILDWIKKNYYFIKVYQDHMKSNIINIARFRPRKINLRIRNEFIYKNRSKKLKRIAEELASNHEIFMDEGHIAKIISLETLRRKKV